MSTCAIHSGICEACNSDHRRDQLHLTPNRHFYVTIARDHRRGFLLGPYATEAEALANVNLGRKLAERADWRAAFDAFGTASSEQPITTVFGTDEEPRNR